MSDKGSYIQLLHGNEGYSPPNAEMSSESFKTHSLLLIYLSPVHVGIILNLNLEEACTCTRASSTQAKQDFKHKTTSLTE